MAPTVRGGVDVVIPTLNAAALVRECVEHLTDAAVARRIVVDDGSTDDIAGALTDGPPVDVVRLERSQGLAHAMNAGAAQATAPYILFLNNDIFAVPGAVDRLTNAFAARPAAGSAAGRLVDPETGATQPSYQPRSLPGPTGIVARLTGVERAWPLNPVTGRHLRHPLPDDRPVLTSRQPAGACLLVRRADFEQVGGWDERYWIWYEDVDLSRRLLARGPALYEPGAVFRHVGGASTGHWDKPEQHRRLYHGTLRYSEAHFGSRGRVAVGATAIAVALPRIAGYHRQRPAAADVYRQVLRGGAALVTGREVPSLKESVTRPVVGRWLAGARVPTGADRSASGAGEAPGVPAAEGGGPPPPRM